jgi:Ca2+-binding EF-hand superfamily protein
MGCGGSSELPKIGESQMDLDFLKDYLSLTNSDIKMLQNGFRKIDLRGSGTVDFDEFCVRIRCESTIFLENIYGFFSSAQTQGGHFVGLNFAEFSLFVCFFLTLDEPGLAQYLYKILTFNEFNSHLSKQQTLSIANIEHNIKCLFGKELKDSKLHQTMIKMDSNHDGVLSKEEFVQCCLKNKSILFPAVSLQISMKERILSMDFWERKSGLGNRLLGTIRDVRDDLHNLLRDQRRQRRHPSLAEGDIATGRSHSRENGIEASQFGRGGVEEDGDIKPSTQPRPSEEVVDLEI